MLAISYKCPAIVYKSVFPLFMLSSSYMDMITDQILICYLSFFLFQTAQYLGEKLASKGHEQSTNDFLLLLRHPTACSAVLRVNCDHH